MDKEKKPQPKTDLPLQSQDGLPALKKHLGPASLSQPTHKGYMNDLEKARNEQNSEEAGNGNGSGQTKP